ncbi:MAG: diadenylate cyclase CdaA [Candidatus Gastranaerophilales bacterium]
MNDIFAYIIEQIKALNMSMSWSDVIQIIILALMLFFLYQKFIKNTNSEKFVKGLLIIVFAWIFSEILVRIDLKIFGMFLKSVVTLVTLSLIVIFQPELRKFLGFLGQVDFISRNFISHNKHKNIKIDVVKELIEAVKYLSKSHTGALIVFQKDLSFTYSDVGCKLNADVSTELILTIFHPNTPLHDGAIVIDGGKIISAGVLLPLTEDPKLSWKYGTRHRAAIGMTENSNAACLVVSEETGDVSVAVDGVLKKYEDIVSLKTDLESILGVKNVEEDDGKKNIFKFNNFMAIKKGSSSSSKVQTNAAD